MAQVAAPLRALLVVLFAAVLCACGGGDSGSGGNGGPSSGGSNRYSISLGTQTLNFDVSQSSASPTQNVAVTFSGAGVVVATRPGESMPNWLAVDPATVTSTTQVTVPVRARTDAPGLVPGSYSFTLRFVTGDANGNNAAYTDLVVNFIVREGFSISQGGVTFTAVQSSANLATPQAGFTVNLRGYNAMWAVQSVPAWIHVTPSSGTAAGPVQISVDSAGMTSSPQSAMLTFHDSTSNSDARIAVALNVVASAPTVGGQALPLLNALGYSFNVDASTATGSQSTTVPIFDNALGTNPGTVFNWTGRLATSQFGRTTPSLIVLSPASGSTLTSSNLQLSVREQMLRGLPSGTYSQRVDLDFSRSTAPTFTDAIGTTTVIRLPRLGSAEPYLIPSGTPATLHLIGEDLRSEDLPRLRLDGAALPGTYTVTLVSAQELTLSVPALAAGHHVLSFANAMNLPRSAAEFTVYSPLAAPGAGNLPGSGNRAMLIYEPAFRTLFAADEAEQEVERYQWNGTQWINLGAVAVPGVRRIARMRDGQNIVVTGRDGYYKLPLDVSSSTLTLIQDTSFLNCSSAGIPGSAVATEAGSLFLTVFQNPCSPYGSVLEYDLLSGTYDNPTQNGLAGASYANMPSWSTDAYSAGVSGDGRYVALGYFWPRNTAGSTYYHLFDLRTRQPLAPVANGAGSAARVSVDYAGTRVLIGNQRVVDRSGAILGLLPFTGFQPLCAASALSRDGSRVLCYVHGAAGTGYFRMLDVSASVGATNVFPQAGSDIPVPEDMGTPDSRYYESNAQGITSFGLEWSADGHLAFLGGSTRVVVKSIP